MNSAPRNSSVPEQDAPVTALPGELVVIGGGCYGSYHARQLLKARDKGAIRPAGIVIVDREADCPAAAEFRGVDGVRQVTAEWGAFYDDYFDSHGPESTDRIVPTPISSHLMSEWMQRRALSNGGVRIVEEPFQALPKLPFAARSPAGSGLLSYADWVCPVTCIEPAVCPETRGPKDWEMDDAVFRYARERRVGAFDLVEVFRIRHFTWGVAAFPVSLAVGTLRRIDAAARRCRDRRRSARVLAATVSSCHGVMNQFLIEPAES